MARHKPRPLAAAIVAALMLAFAMVQYTTSAITFPPSRGKHWARSMARMSWPAVIRDSRSPRRERDCSDDMLRRFCLILPFVVFIAVCSSNDENAVTGTVTVDGKPAAQGAITFFPLDAQARTTGTKIIDGKYSARVPGGMQKVEIHVPKVIGRKKLYNTPDSPLEDITDESLPARYHSQSELKLDVKPGINQKDFSLTTK